MTARIHSDQQYREDLRKKYERELEDCDELPAHDTATVSITGDVVVYTLAKKLPWWEIEGVPPPEYHGPQTEDHARLCDMMRQLVIDMHKRSG